MQSAKPRNWLLTTGQDYAPGGRLSLGQVLLAPFDPDSAIFSEGAIPVPPHGEKIVETNFKDNLSASFELWSQFCRVRAGAELGGSMQRSNKASSQIETLTAHIFFPSLLYVEAAWKSADVSNRRRRWKWLGKRFYMVTGVMTAHGAGMDTQRPESKDAHGEAEADATVQGVPMAAGVKGSAIAGSSDRVAAKNTSDFVFAYRLSEVYWRRAVVGVKPYTRGVIFGLDAGNEDTEEKIDGIAEDDFDGDLDVPHTTHILSTGSDTIRIINVQTPADISRPDSAITKEIEPESDDKKVEAVPDVSMNEPQADTHSTESYNARKEEREAEEASVEVTVDTPVTNRASSPGKRATARNVADVLKGVESTSFLYKDTCPPVTSSSASELIAKIFSWAAAVISKEPPLASGNRRVRWKCVCGRIFHDDFTEIKPGAVNEVQKSLNELYGPVSATKRSSSIASNPIEADQETSMSGSTRFSENQFTASNAADIGLQNLPSDRRQNRQSSMSSEILPGSVRGHDFVEPGPSDTGDKRLWLIPCFNSPVFGTRAQHEDVSKGMYDFEMFTRFREIYFSQKSWIRRFFDLKEVKFIRFVRFDYLSLGKASILNRDDINSWPPEEDRHQWIYVPCPPKALPLVGQEHLLHLWRNPHHADRMVYEDWQRNANRLQRYSEWIRHLPTPKDLIPDLELQEQPRRSAYVFVKIPKKKGDKLDPDYGDQKPQGWGIMLEEVFKVHRLLVVILFFYLITSMAVIIWIFRKYGVTGPTTEAALFWVLAWFTSFFSLLLTVWFKWAEST